MKEFTVGNFLQKRIVKIDDDNSVSICAKDGRVIRRFEIGEIFGINYAKPVMGRTGTLAIADNFDDSQITTWTTFAAWPHSVSITNWDEAAAEEILAWFEEHKTADASSNPYEFFAKTSGSFLAIDSNTVVIRHTGLLNQISRGGMQGEKRIPIKSVLSVQFKKANGATAGYIQFETAGGSANASRGGLFEAAGDENSVVFTAAEMPQFEKIRDRVNEILGQHSPSVAQLSQADELAKFAALRDQGIITADEFDQKKKQILGL